MKPPLTPLATLATVVLLSAPAAAKPVVVTSIPPVAALAAGVMEGVDTPTVIVRGNASPHTYTMRPSEARALSRADVIFWIGPSYEGFLQKPLAGLSKRQRVVELQRAPGVKMLPAREGGAWEEDHDHDHVPVARGRVADVELDGHMFLDPENAKAIVQAIAAALGEVDKENAPTYQSNGTRLAERIDALGSELGLILGPVQKRPFIVFHDAYQYLERRYDLAAVGSVTVSPERLPGARRVRELRRKVTDSKAICVFSEPQFEPALVKTLIEGTGAKTAVLDPVGGNLPPTSESYLTLMRNLARSLAGCLVD
jgi:zinc transport system substrate-binding protein